MKKNHGGESCVEKYKVVRQHVCGCMCVYVCVLASFAIRLKLLQPLRLMKENNKRMAKDRIHSGTPKTGWQKKTNSSDKTPPDWAILHSPYSDLVRELHNNYWPTLHSLLHPTWTDTSASTKKNTRRKVRKAVRKVHTKKSK